MVEYKYFRGNEPVRAKSIERIRERFIAEEGKNHATNIFRTSSAVAVGRIWYGYGKWMYTSYEKDMVYEIGKNGKVIRNLGRRV